MQLEYYAVSHDLIHAPSLGLTLRQDKIATYVYSQHHGFTFYAPTNDFTKLAEHIARCPEKAPPGYEALFGKKSKSNQRIVHRELGDGTKFNTVPTAERPLVLNWMISGQCNLQCVYCYAQDLMKLQAEPTQQEITDTINVIKEYRPLAVVLTGGEPTLSPYFSHAIKCLSKFTTVIVDTNATKITDEHINTFKINNVHVRISIDSDRPQINAKTRVPKSRKNYIKDFSNILETMHKLHQKNIIYTINTVATTKNYDDIKSMEEHLSQFNPMKIRIRLVEESSCIKNYAALVGPKKRRNRFLSYTASHLYTSIRIPIYYSYTRTRSSIIIIAPSGEFYTESSIVDNGKIIIDELSPRKPSREAIYSKVDMPAHSLRYLTS